MRPKVKLNDILKRGTPASRTELELIYKDYVCEHTPNEVLLVLKDAQLRFKRVHKIKKRRII